MAYRTFNSDEIDHRQTYRLLIGSIVPRPIAWVSSLSPSGTPNLAPFSFFTMVSHAPPMLSISVGEREHQMKDTGFNIMETKDFVVHTVTDGWEEAMNESSANLDPDKSEFDFAGLETEPSVMVSAPRIKNAPVAMECRFDRMIEFGDDWRTFLVIGKILCWHVREDLMLEDKYVDPWKLKPVGRLGGPRYCRTHEIFEMAAPYSTPDRHDPNAPDPDARKVAAGA